MVGEGFIIQFFNRIQDDTFLRTKKGLLFIVFSIHFIFTCLIKFFSNPSYNIVLSIILALVYFFYWLYYSGRLFFSSKIKIVFAMGSCEETNNYYEQIIRTINSKIDELNLFKNIRIIQMPADCTFLNSIEAERYIKKRMIDLLIWGNVLEGKMQESLLSEFKFRFTYLYRVLPEQTRSIFVKRIGESLRGRYWRVLDENSFVDIQVVSTNITEASLFIIALCLYVRGELAKSIEIFEKLKLCLFQKNDIDFPNISTFKDNINSYLVEGYRFIGTQIRDENPIASKDCFDKLLNIRPDDSGAHLNMAMLCYMIDRDLDAARKHTDQITDPMIKPLTNYNYAFFGIVDRDPVKVLKYYQRTRAVSSENIVELISFLQNQFLEDSKNILYHFALGYINIYHIDSKIGIEELGKFIDKAKDDARYKVLIENAQPLIESAKRKHKRNLRCF